MPSKVHDKTDSMDKPVNLLTKQKPTDPKTLRDRVDESNQHGPAAKGLLIYEANKYGIKNGKTNKGGNRRKSKKKQKILKAPLK